MDEAETAYTSETPLDFEEAKQPELTQRRKQRHLLLKENANRAQQRHKEVKPDVMVSVPAAKADVGVLWGTAAYNTP